MAGQQRQGASHVEVPKAKLRPAQMIRLHRLARELRLTDQILSTDLDSVSIIDNGPAPAWTSLDGDHVSFALEKMPMPVSRVDLAVWLGTNAHELGHVLFSPRRHSILMRRVIDASQGHMPAIARLHNIVEDQRQERLVLARFAPWRAYLTAALGHHLVADDDSAWLLLAGRTWLPDATRSEARARFAKVYGRPSADEVVTIIGEYQRLTDPGSTESDEAWDLLIRLHDLFDVNVPQPGYPCQPTDGGEPETSEPGDDAPETADEADPGEGDGQGDGEGAGESAGRGAGGKADDEDDPKAGQTRARRQLTEAAAEQIATDDEAAEDLDSILEALRSGRSGAGVDGQDPIGRFEPATDEARRLHHEVGDALLDLKDASEPGWLKRVDSGRLSVRRLVDPACDPDQLFDRYEPGQMDASELELVLLLDVSSSMYSQLHRLAEAAWAIRHAVDDLEGTATVITWDDGPHRVLAAPGVRPDDRMFVPGPGGGTDPATALAEAYRLLADSRARNRLAVILTDGDWYVPAHEVSPAHQVIRAMNEAGVVTVCALLGIHAGTQLHHCRHGGRINDPMDLARLFQKVAAAQIGAWR
jgi:hypothetical protein